MARTSKKDHVLSTAYAIIETDGIEAITYDRLAEETELSKSGLIYHFPTRHHLLVDIHTFAAQRWEQRIIAQAGTTHEQLSDRDRFHAALLTMSGKDPLAELLLGIHSLTHPDFAAPWDSLERRWLPDPGGDFGEGDFPALVASLLAHGLWAHDHMTFRQLSPANRQRLVEFMLGLLAE